MENVTLVKNFILLGFSNFPHWQFLFFVIFLCIYIATVFGNLLILVVVNIDSALWKPMYFFLKNLSVLEICYTSVTIPKLLENTLALDKTISLHACASQLFFFLFFAATECCLLGFMAYDRYVAICNPLHYSVIMRNSVCIQFAALSWTCGCLVAVGHTTFIFSLPFCESNIINHFYCEIQPLLKLVCGDTYWNEIQIIAAAAFLILIPFLLILLSYFHIIATILRMKSAKSCQKAFSTCSSHFIVVSLFYGTAIFIYICPKSSYSLNVDKLLSLFYSVVTPILNPIIYSLRNKDVKGALKRTALKLMLSK